MTLAISIGEISVSLDLHTGLWHPIKTNYILKVVFMITDTWGQLVSTILTHKTCINTSRQVLEKNIFAINAIFTQENNLSKTESRGVLAENKRYMFKILKTLILTYLHRPRRHSSSQSQNVSQRSCQIRTNYFQTFHP